ncbi:MAG: hypothetical protein M1540_07360 [Candidatus Bathyarchaeota archaeon]|nr:hypothetical protein [Candidatus Bathyarchaeota archaeon]
MLNKIKSALQKNPREVLNTEHLSRNKTYALIALAATVVVIVIVALFVPKGAATIPLKVDYIIGEKMVYCDTITSTLESFSTLTMKPLLTVPNNTCIKAQEIVQVISFDGENYLLNRTTMMTLNDEPLSFLSTERINRTGYSTYLLNTGNTNVEITNNSVFSGSYITQLINNQEVNIGDVITVPYPNLNPGIDVTGELTVSFSGIEDLSVPAGTYKVFRIDITGSNIIMRLANSTVDVSNTFDVNNRVYLEYGSLRQIQCSMQKTVHFQSSTVNATTQMTNDLILTQHIKP